MKCISFVDYTKEKSDYANKIIFLINVFQSIKQLERARIRVLLLENKNFNKFQMQ